MLFFLTLFIQFTSATCKVTNVKHTAGIPLHTRLIQANIQYYDDDGLISFLLSNTGSGLKAYVKRKAYSSSFFLILGKWISIIMPRTAVLSPSTVATIWPDLNKMKVGLHPCLSNFTSQPLATKSDNSLSLIVSRHIVHTCNLVSTSDKSVQHLFQNGVMAVAGPHHSR